MRRPGLFRVVARQEWRLLWTDRVALVAMLGMALAIAYAGREGLQRAEQWRTDFDAYQQLQSQHLGRFERRAQAILEQLESGRRGPVRIYPREFDWGPHIPDFPLAWVPPRAALPAAPLAAAAIGDTELAAVVLSGSRFDGDAAELAQQPGNPLQALLGHFDLAFVVVVLFPLYIIALTFDLFAAERDRGTLPLLLAQPVSGPALTAGKVLARGLAAVGWPAVLMAGVLLPEALPQPGAASRLLAWTAAAIGYGLFWVGLAVRFNIGRRPAAVNAVALGAVWLLLAGLSPAVMHAMLQAVHPAPPRAAWVNLLREAEMESRLQREALTVEQQRAAVERLLAENPEMAQDAASYTGLALSRAVSLAVTTQSIRDLAPVREAFEGPRRAQEDLLAWLRFLSPSVLVQGALYDLAGSGRARYEAFLEQARAFQREVDLWAADRRLRQVQMTSEQYASIPRFHFVEESAGTVVRRTAVPLAVLWMLALAVMLWGLRAARRIAPF